MRGFSGTEVFRHDAEAALGLSVAAAISCLGPKLFHRARFECRKDGGTALSSSRFRIVQSIRKLTIVNYMSGNPPMDLGVSPFGIKNILESRTL